MVCWSTHASKADEQVLGETGAAEFREAMRLSTPAASSTIYKSNVISPSLCGVARRWTRIKFKFCCSSKLISSDRCPILPSSRLQLFRVLAGRRPFRGSTRELSE